MRNLKLHLNPKSRKLWIIIIILIIGIILFYITQQPSIGTVKTLLPQDLKEPKKEEETLWDKARQKVAQKVIKIEEEESKTKGINLYKGKYLSFPYPNSFYLKTHEATTGGILERVVLLGAGQTPKKLAVTAVETSKGDTFDDVSGVKMRRLKPKIYQEKPLDISGQKGILFEKKEETFEKTAFILKDRLLVTIALTSVNRDSQLDTDFDYILKNLTF